MFAVHGFREPQFPFAILARHLLFVTGDLFSGWRAGPDAQVSSVFDVVDLVRVLYIFGIGRPFCFLKDSKYAHGTSGHPRYFITHAF